MATLQKHSNPGGLNRLVHAGHTSLLACQLFPEALAPPTMAPVGLQDEDAAGAAGRGQPCRT